MRESTPFSRADWYAAQLPIAKARSLVEAHHYAKGASNTAVYTHGLFNIHTGHCHGVAWWIPPTKSAAIATYSGDWQRVLSLSRFVITPDTPKNAASFLLGASMRMIDRSKWACLVTYADSWQGHEGTIYKATNWTYVGVTKPSDVWIKNGRMVARKCGPKTRTKQEMLELGAQLMGRFPKKKFIHVVGV